MSAGRAENLGLVARFVEPVSARETSTSAFIYSSSTSTPTASSTGPLPHDQTMVLDVHPRVGQPVQRRVSYRRLREEENNSEGSSSNGGENFSLDHNHGGGVLLPRAASMTTGAFDGGNDNGHGFSAAEQDSDNSTTNHRWASHSSAVTDPSSIFHEAWLAVRCSYAIRKIPL